MLEKNFKFENNFSKLFKLFWYFIYLTRSLFNIWDGPSRPPSQKMNYLLEIANNKLKNIV